MINQEYDGIVPFPYNESPNGVIEEAEEAGIPVFTANQDATTEAVKSFTAFGNENAGQICGERMYEALTEQKPDVDTYRALNVQVGISYPPRTPGPTGSRRHGRTGRRRDRRHDPDELDTVGRPVEGPDVVERQRRAPRIYLEHDLWTGEFPGPRRSGDGRAEG